MNSTWLCGSRTIDFLYSTASRFQSLTSPITCIWEDEADYKVFASIMRTLLLLLENQGYPYDPAQGVAGAASRLPWLAWRNFLPHRKFPLFKATGSLRVESIRGMRGWKSCLQTSHMLESRCTPESSFSKGSDETEARRKLIPICRGNWPGGCAPPPCGRWWSENPCQAWTFIQSGPVK